MSEIRENGIQRLMRDNGELRAQVAQLALELTGCRDLIATLRSRVAERECDLTRIAEAQRPHCTTECIEGVWWAKGNGIVAGPQVTEQEVLLEVAEMAARTTEEDAITALPADRRWEELRAWIVAMQAKAESYRQWDDLWSMFDLVLDQMDRLADGAENT